MNNHLPSLLFTTAVAIVAAAGVITFPAATEARQSIELTVYTSFETELLNRYKSAFEASNPDITINWVRDSIGVMTAKLLAEKNNNHADVVWGLAGSSMASLKNEGVLTSYTPTGLDQTRPEYNDPDKSPAWYGNQIAFNVVCFNEALAKARNIPRPESWNDLLDPVYQGQIAMPDPASSGTGYMQVFTWLQTFGEEKAWGYMEKLHSNVAQYTHSGSKPCVQAAMGEVVVGISLSTRAGELKKMGAPLALILPKEGIGWDPDAIGLVNNNHNDSTKQEAAKRLINWAISQQANTVYAQSAPLVNHRAVTADQSDYPTLHSTLAALDFTAMAGQRQTILKTWADRFHNKSEAGAR